MTTNKRRRTKWVSVVAAMTCVCAGSANAATWHVKTLEDSYSNPDSLRYIVFDQARDGDTIEFDVTGTISLINGPLFIEHNLNIQGPGANLVTLSGNGSSRVMEVDANASISGLTIADGYAVLTPLGDGPEGAGMLVLDWDVTVSDCVFSGNVVQATFDTQACGGGIANYGNLTLLRCSFTGNSAKGQPKVAGLDAYPFVRGGAIYNEGNGRGRLNNPFATRTNQLVICACTFSGNSVVGAAPGDDVSRTGTGSGGAIFNCGYLLMTNTTLFANSAQGNEHSSGGALYNVYWSEHSGITGDQSDGIMALVSCTISGNSAAQSGGVYLSGNYDTYRPPLMLSLGNTILAGNTATSSQDPDHEIALFGWMTEDLGPGAWWTGDFLIPGYSVRSLGYNLVGVGGLDALIDGPHGWLADPFDLVGYLEGPRPPLDPQLGLLEDNGGPTLTMAPFASSLAVDSGFNIGPMPEDQRGAARTYNWGNPLGWLGDKTDRGAFELQPPPPEPRVELAPAARFIPLEGSGSMSVISPDAQSYQWLLHYTNIVGATNATLLFSNVQPWQVGDYSVLLSNAQGTTVSPVAALKAICLLNIATNPGAVGTVVKTPSQSSYVLGSSLTLTALPRSNYVFQSWSGDLISSNNPLTVVMNTNLQVAANFVFDTSALSFTPIPPQVVTEGTPLNLTLNASGPGVTNLLYTLEGWYPPGAILNSGTGQFAWTPAEGQGPATYQFTVRAAPSNSPSASVLQILTVGVLESNRPPFLGVISNKTVMQLASLSFVVTATNSDIPPNPLLLSLDPGAPTNANIDAVSGLFSWTPTLDQAPGGYPITVRATNFNPYDTNAPSLSTTQSFLVTVTPLIPRTDLWINGSSGRWDLPPTNWSSGTPLLADSVIFTNVSSKTLTLDDFTATYFPASMTTSNLTISAPAGATNTLFLSNVPTDRPLHLLGSLLGQSGGALWLSNSIMQVDGGLLCGSNSVVRLDGGTLSTGGATLAQGAVLSGSGTVNGALLNSGTILGDGATLTIYGPLTNNGTLGTTNGGVVVCWGQVVNYGVINAGQVQFPGGLQNCETVLVPFGVVHSLTNLNNDGPGSLRDAILNSASGDTITANLTGWLLVTNELLVDHDLNFLLPGAKDFTISGGNTTRVFHILPGVTVNISGVTIAYGMSSNSYGSGFLVEEASLNMSDGMVVNCTNTGVYGGSDGGDIVGGAGVFSYFGEVSCDRCTFRGNSSVALTPNDAGGSAIFNAGGGLFLTNCTFSGNASVAGLRSAAYGGAIENITDIPGALVNCTISGNSAVTDLGTNSVARGGGVLTTYVSAPPTNGPPLNNLLQLKNNLIGGNITIARPGGAVESLDIDGPIASLGFNAVGQGGNNSGPWTSSDLIGSVSTPLDLKLDALMDNGGPTETIALLAGSAALGTGNSDGIPPDQRGQPRPATGSDIGAFQTQGAAPEPPRLALSLQGTNALLSWNAYSGQAYVVQKASLNDPQWPQHFANASPVVYAPAYGYGNTSYVAKVAIPITPSPSDSGSGFRVVRFGPPPPSAFDDAGQPAYAQGWQAGQNGGRGFMAWVFLDRAYDPFNPSPQPQDSHYLGDSSQSGIGNINSSNGKSWSLSAEDRSALAAFRVLRHDLAVNQTLEFDIITTGPDPSSLDYLPNSIGILDSPSIGFTLSSKDPAFGMSQVNGGGVTQNGGRFSLEVFGPQSSDHYSGLDDYWFMDTPVGGGQSIHTTIIPPTDGTLHIAFILTGSDTYSLTLSMTGFTDYHFAGTLLGSGSIHTLQIFNSESAGSPLHDLFFNNLRITP